MDSRSSTHLHVSTDVSAAMADVRAAGSHVRVTFANEDRILFSLFIPLTLDRRAPAPADRR
jgi:hypothetical protein